MFDERSLDGFDWDGLQQQLDQDGCAVIKSLLSDEDCADISAMYSQFEPFRSQVMMAAMVLAVASTSTSSIHCLNSSAACVARSTLVWWRSPIAGTNVWTCPPDSPINTTRLFSAAMPLVRNVRPPYCCSTVLKTTTACIRICTVNMFSRCKWRFFCQHRMKNSQEASSC